MTAITIQRSSILAFIVSFIKSIFRRIGLVVQALQEDDAPGHLNKLADQPIPGINDPLQRNRAKRWRDYTPSRFVRWITLNSGPNRKQRRDEAKKYLENIRHAARRKLRLEEQQVRKQLRMA